MLKFKADIRAVAYMIIISIMFYYFWTIGYDKLVSFDIPTIVLYVIYGFFAVSVSVMTHNHCHINIWNHKYLNMFTDWWLTVFYGVPVFTWIPTHNRNHHKYNNKEGDSSLTYRHTEENNLLSLLSYPSVSGFHQLTMSVIPYMKELKKKDKTLYYQNWLQVFILAAWIIGFLILDWKKAILFVILPQQLSGFMVFVFNYVQHVHADEESRWNHSRNFMGVNLFLFNNGYHTIHHDKAFLHWSQAPAEHEKIKANIDPDLIEPSFFWYVIRTHVLSLFVPSWRSHNRRKARIEAQGKPFPPTTLAQN
ncbi:MAG: fatty acid desaturase [Bacteroidetes bacterium]|nr:fatty acid desaturase [Bacteroidota bacterium]